MRSTTSHSSIRSAPDPAPRAAAPVVRAVTAALDPTRDDPGLEVRLQGLFDRVGESLAATGMPVQTCRVVMPELATDELLDESYALATVEATARRAAALGARWFLVPINLVDLPAKDCRRAGALAFEVMRRFPTAFVNLIAADAELVNPAAAAAAADTVAAVSGLAANGYDNFRLGVSLNPRPDGAFFPFSRLDGPDRFTLAVEVTRLLTEVAAESGEVGEFQQRAVAALAEHASELNEIAERHAHDHGVEFAGMDLSIAPYPDAGVSVLPLLRHLGLEQFGGQGTFFLTGILSRVLKAAAQHAGVPSVGFNGVMYSLLEDADLAAAVRGRSFGIDSLLGYSTMCGCGIDMVPVPGDVHREEIASLILDVAAVAIGLDKPLGVRVLPIPGRHANEETAFDLDFLVNTKILPVRHLSLDDRVLNGAPMGLWP